MPIVRGAMRSANAEESADGALAAMTVRFSRLDTWYPIASWWEGDFLERVASGAFSGVDDPSSVRVLFNHGYDASLGGRALGVPTAIEERDGYACADVPLFDTTYNRDLLPGIRSGAYGSSFMFDVEAESWERDVEASPENPKGLPMRTITRVSLYEAGPVTWPANPEADVQANSQRSGTDWYYAAAARAGRLDDAARAELRAKITRPVRVGRHSAARRARMVREMAL